MDNRNSNMTFGNTLISWGIAGLAGLIAFLLLRIMGDWSLSAAGFGGGAIALVLIIVFTVIFGRDLPPLGTVTAPTVKSGSAVPTSSPTAGTSSAPSQAASAAVAAGSASAGGGGAAATSPAATGTPSGQGAAKPSERSEASLAEAAATPAGATSASGGKPEMLDSPRGGAADDLKRIKGIGPKLEKLCNSMGVYHFEQIAGWSAGEVAWMDDNIEGFRGRVTRDDWVAQAKALAAGEETEFSKKVDKGGVY
ncbi:Predicted 5' DNA nuclease, flap endonuclease-1-like, helix-3-turn-helix (H3TH) domain [Jannaschia faecimaris]|uniref:Predicted 5' DNA nuclease, flap endonuclease-1-like, helix-3-turn-helix (H3TH) domain n=1 Tax=Jannaschia faecimaris TaxID=1244108 RepID=A0A1H3PT78_9RHOB|nr:NADH:ubiquinone oxidoreductase [Jannaschia faecimaris]SDZ04085.1 Predicted 5' DNA nuclease, flap endonuclease-1-like, helix-3-turn-helix (H3TH) domain [Jannaschia faecimaris]